MMKKPIETYNSFDVVVVPFPFTDSKAVKRRPALVLSSKDSFNDKNGQVVLCMITSAFHNPWALDVKIKDLKSAGLTTDSIIRMKLFTLDSHLILKKIGVLKKIDQKSVTTEFNALFKSFFKLQK